jgi:trehalose 6-phosphate synthase/phosphatase
VRVIVVSNRLPITVSRTAGGFEVGRSSGGLATGLKAVHEQSGGVWVGWPGFAGPPPDEHRAALDERYAQLSVAPVTLSGDEVEQYYEGFCNGVVWPLLHGFPAQLPLDPPPPTLYETVNQRFADAVVEQYRPGDVIWVHDYQLMRVPLLLRRALPGARIGFFLHVPFPDSDTFRILPARTALLEGVLAADLVGFHTAAYARHFSSAALHVLGAEVGPEGVSYDGRHAAVGVFPMGVDARAFETRAASDEVAQQMATFQSDPSVRLLVGIDRLDYTKGIPRRLLAYERLLADHPELRGRVRLVQVAVPSRTQVEAYAESRHTVDALVGRINGRFGTPSWAPVHYVYRNLSEAEVVALYRAADVMVVTPIRDGMNLVAKEFVASRADGHGVLVLSEFAGAASELAEAVQVNPYDIDGLARALHRALEMSEDERATRMATLRHRVFTYDVAWWAEAFLERLGTATARPPSTAPTPQRAREVTVSALQAAPALVLLLDYDGTLVPITDVPDLAKPDGEALRLLTALAARPGTFVHVVSGRARDSLERFLGKLPIGLHAEHGFWSRDAAGAWVSHHALDDAWRPKALEVLEDFAARTPGSLVEQKRSGLAFHYRMADREYGPRQANELKLHLASVFSNAPVEVLAGDQVVELRPHGAHKGQVVTRLRELAPAGALFAAFGDDRTDEDLFKALPAGSVAVRVGPGPSVAPIRLANVREVRAMLSALLGPARAT